VREPLLSARDSRHPVLSDLTSVLPQFR
jgi:hypothetical protein